MGCSERCRYFRYFSGPKHKLTTENVAQSRT
jgi:hypothetical protein